MPDTTESDTTFYDNLKNKMNATTYENEFYYLFKGDFDDTNVLSLTQEQREAVGLILDRTTKDVVCVSPPKMISIKDVNFNLPNSAPVYNVRKYTPGTTLRVFWDHHNEKWEVSTNSLMHCDKVHFFSQQSLGEIVRGVFQQNDTPMDDVFDRNCVYGFIVTAPTMYLNYSYQPNLQHIFTFDRAEKKFIHTAFDFTTLDEKYGTKLGKCITEPEVMTEIKTFGELKEMMNEHAPKASLFGVLFSIVDPIHQMDEHYWFNQIKYRSAYMEEQEHLIQTIIQAMPQGHHMNPFMFYLTSIQLGLQDKVLVHFPHWGSIYPQMDTITKDVVHRLWEMYMAVHVQQDPEYKTSLKKFSRYNQTKEEAKLYAKENPDKKENGVCIGKATKTIMYHVHGLYKKRIVNKITPDSIRQHFADIMTHCEHGIAMMYQTFIEFRKQNEIRAFQPRMSHVNKIVYGPSQTNKK